MWGFDLINMQISHVWGTSDKQIPYYYEQQITDLHSDITEKFILLIKAGSKCSLVAQSN